MRIEITHAEELDGADWACWRALQDASAALASPFYAPEFTQILAQERSGGAIAVARQGGRIQGFLPLRVSRRGTASPLAAPLSFANGPIGVGFDAEALRAAVGVVRIGFSEAAPSASLFQAHMMGVSYAWRADCVDGKAAYAATLAMSQPALEAELEAARSRLEADHGALRVKAAFDAWGAPDLALTWCGGLRGCTSWRRPWARGVLARTTQAAARRFAGVWVCAQAGDRPVALAHLLMSSAEAECWLVATDPAFAGYHLDLLVRRWCVDWAADAGFPALNFGPNAPPSAQRLATSRRPVLWGAIEPAAQSGAGAKTRRTLMQQAAPSL